MVRLAFPALLAALVLTPLPASAGDGGEPRIEIAQADPYPTLRRLRPRPSPEAVEQARRQIETENRIKPFVDAFHAVQQITNLIYGG